MQRDFKVGLVVGVCALLGVLIWLASRESLTPEARLEKHFQQTQTQSQPNMSPPRTVSLPQRTSIPTATQAQQESEKVVTLSPTLGLSEESNEIGPVDLATPRTRPKIKTQPYHIVQKGETLSEISQKHYGSVRYVKVIMAANQDLIKNADLIQPGMRLILPDINQSP